MKKAASLFVLILSAALLICALGFAVSASEAEPSVSIEKLNLSFEDNVYIKYAVKLEGDDALASSLGMLFWTESRDSYEKGTEASSAAPLGYQIIEGEKYYTFSYKRLTAKQMTDVIYARAYVEKDGAIYYSDVKPYSIVAYASNRLGLIDGVEGSADPDFRAMLRAMLEYGARAQIYYGYSTDRLATDIFTPKYEISVSGGALSDNGTGGTFAAGTELTLIAEVREGFSFSHWEDESGAYVGSNATQTVTVNKGRTYIAKFKPIAQTGELSFDTDDGVTFYVSGIGSWSEPIVTVPETYQGYPVTAIGMNAFKNATFVTDIVLPDCIELIGSKAFIGCSALQSLTIPHGCTTVGNYAFDGCTSLKTIYCNANLSFDSDSTVPFTGSTIEAVIFGEKVTEIGTYAFYGMPNLKTVTLNGKITAIKKYAFYNCPLIKQIELPLGLQTLGTYAFSKCTGLLSIDVPHTVTSFESYVFSGCTSLGSINVGAAVVGSNAFEGCTALTSVILPDTVASIGSNVFKGCTALAELTVPFLGASIDSNSALYYLFGGSSGSNVPKSLKKVTVTVDRSLTASVFASCPYIETVVLPDALTKIPSSAFKGCTALKTVYICDRVTNIEDSAFANCTSLLDVHYNGIQANWDKIVFGNSNTAITSDAVIHCKSPTYFDFSSGLRYTENGDGTCRVGIIPTTALKEIVIPAVSPKGDRVVRIEAYGFMDAAITSLVIPDSVVSIGDYAFAGCEFASVNISDNVTMVGSYLFDQATVGSISIGNGIKRIEANTFGTVNVTGIALSESVTFIAQGALRGCTGLITLELPFVGGSRTSSEKFGYIFTTSSSYSNYDYVPSTLKNVNIVSGEAQISTSAFEGCTGLTSITIPESVSTIGSYAFRDCTSLTSITIPDSVTTIGNCAFYDCTSLMSITLPAGVTAIGNSAFSGCTSLTSIEIPEGVTTIGDYAFSYCKELTSVTIPDSVTTIGNHAFDNCTSLTSITIPDSVTTIGDYAFSNTRLLKTVYYRGTAEGWGEISIGTINNSYLTGAARYYYSETVPETAGNYWHYGANGEILVWEQE